MGARGNIVIHDGNDAPVWLYTHWGGEELKVTLARALKRGVRWDDAPYLARIVFDEMTKGRQGEETGFGISTQMCDNEYPILHVHPDGEEGYVEIRDADDKTVAEKYTFKGFVLKFLLK